MLESHITSYGIMSKTLFKRETSYDVLYIHMTKI